MKRRVNVAGLVKRRVISWQTIANKFLNRREEVALLGEWISAAETREIVTHEGIILQRNNSTRRWNVSIYPPTPMYVSTIREARFREGTSVVIRLTSCKLDLFYTSPRSGCKVQAQVARASLYYIFTNRDRWTTHFHNGTRTQHARLPRMLETIEREIVEGWISD